MDTPSSRMAEITRQIKDLEKELSETLQREKATEYSDAENDKKHLEEVNELMKQAKELEANPAYSHLFTNKYSTALITSPDEKAFLERSYQKTVSENLQKNLNVALWTAF